MILIEILRQFYDIFYDIGHHLFVKLVFREQKKILSRRVGKRSFSYLFSSFNSVLLSQAVESNRFEKQG